MIWQPRRSSEMIYHYVFRVTCQYVPMATFHFELPEGLQVKLWP